MTDNKVGVNELSRRSGVPVSTVSRVLSGQRWPKRETASKMAEASGMTIGEFLDSIPAA